VLCDDTVVEADGHLAEVGSVQVWMAAERHHDIADGARGVSVAVYAHDRAIMREAAWFGFVTAADLGRNGRERSWWSSVHKATSNVAADAATPVIMRIISLLDSLSTRRS
jgi:hypothetical protein